MSKPSSISVVMPSYNERENIPEALERITKTLGDSLLEIIVVDDNSPDRTWEVIENFRNPRWKVMRRLDKRGLASALADGTTAAKGEIVVWLDCDLGIPPEDITKLLEKIPEYDVAVGSRYVRGGTDERHWFRGFLSLIFNTYARIILGWHFRDWTSGFAAARKEVLDRAPLSHRGFGEYFSEWIYDCSRQKFRIIEVPYHYTLRKAGESKTDSDILVFLRLGFRYAIRVLEIRMGRK